MLNNRDFRAKQFLPFDALNGFSEAIRLVEDRGTCKKILSLDSISYINEKLIGLKKNDNVKIKYYSGFDYIETRGFLKRVDNINKCLYVSCSKINFDDILDIEVL